MIWDFDSVKRIILDLALKVSREPFIGNAAYYKKSGNWKDDFGLDSIQVMNLAAHVNSFFNLFEADSPPYLLSSHQADDWAAMVLQARQHNNHALNFNTSGTSGNAKTISHSMAHLNREVSFLATLFYDATCIIPYVPSYTIYGYLLTIALPQKLNIPVIYPSQIVWRQIPANALIVGTPFNWQLLIDSLPGTQLNCLGVSAAAPLPQSLHQQINASGINLTELYGATETAGIAHRRQPGQPFQFFPYWRLSGKWVEDIDTGKLFTLMDDIESLGNQTFDLLGRKDKQVNIAGHLVDLSLVAAIIKSLPNVQQCSIAAKATHKGVMLQASITLVVDEDVHRDDIKNHIKQTLPAHQMPQFIYFT